MFPLTDTFVRLMNLLIYLVEALLIVFFVAASIALWQQRGRMKRQPYFGDMFFPYRPLMGVILCPLLFIETLRLQMMVPSISRPWARVGLGTFLIVLISMMLFALKIKALGVYSVLEITFATATCIETLLGMQDNVGPVQLFALVASAYLFIRGMDNARTAFKKRRSRKIPDQSDQKTNASKVKE